MQSWIQTLDQTQWWVGDFQNCPARITNTAGGDPTNRRKSCRNSAWNTHLQSWKLIAFYNLFHSEVRRSLNAPANSTGMTISVVVAKLKAFRVEHRLFSPQLSTNTSSWVRTRSIQKPWNGWCLGRSPWLSDEIQEGQDPCWLNIWWLAFLCSTLSCERFCIFATWSREESGSGNRRQVNGPSIYLDHWGCLALATIIFMMNTAAWHLFCTLTMTMLEWQTNDKNSLCNRLGELRWWAMLDSKLRSWNFILIGSHSNLTILEECILI